MRRILAIAAAALTLAAPSAQAMTVGLFFDSDASFANVDAAIAFATGREADATFASSAIDYPRGADTLASSRTLAAFLGEDAGSLSGGGDRRLTTSVTVFRGWLDLAAGPQRFDVGSDDGFALIVGGTEISRFSNPRGFGTTSVMLDAGAGLTPFELVYYENHGNTGVRFAVDGTVVTGAVPPAAIPLPATAPLAILAIGTLALLRRRSS